ncbi:MAG: fibrobacter succinogenes major paralogous domain-containing protein [Bacteroidales bacterium]|nr:fibrobacter succinogenes major paralogous domain-containing protein [Bacteroidales bacterium]
MKKTIRLFTTLMLCTAMALCVSCKKDDDNNEPGGGGNTGGEISGCFSVSSTTTVEFSPGNLYWDGSAFRFEADQWSFANTWNASYVSHFYWSKTASVAYAQDYSDESASTSDVFFTNSLSFQVDGETAGTWRTLSKDEWGYLLNSRTDATNLRAWKELDSGAHKGLVILPDGTENPSTVMGGITSTADLASSGAVFLPAAGYRYGTDVSGAGSYGYSWSGTPSEDYEDIAYIMRFLSGRVVVYSDGRYFGYSVRLVR